MLTVHHLDYSRSTRVLWLLEELGLAYEVKRYRREVGGPAPVELARVHPLGKSPVLVDDELVLAESSAILRYVDMRYGGSRFTPKDPAERARHDEWLDYVEGSLALPLIVPLAGGDRLPAEFKATLATQLAGAWDYMEERLASRDFLMGSDLTLADMQMSYLLAVASATGRLSGHPSIDRYLDRLLARPALIRAIKAGGPMT